MKNISFLFTTLLVVAGIALVASIIPATFNLVRDGYVSRAVKQLGENV